MYSKSSQNWRIMEAQGAFSIHATRFDFDFDQELVLGPTLFVLSWQHRLVCPMNKVKN